MAAILSLEGTPMATKIATYGLGGPVVVGDHLGVTDPGQANF